MRRGLAVLLIMQLLACGKIAVGGGPDGEGYMEPKKTSGPMVMLTIVCAAAAVLGLMWISEQNRKAAAD